MIDQNHAVDVAGYVGGLLLRIAALEEEREHLMGCLARLLDRAALPTHLTAKSFNSRKMLEIKVPARALATASRIVRKKELDNL
jgi:hypothetical protein